LRSTGLTFFRRFGPRFCVCSGGKKQREVSWDNCAGPEVAKSK
jgi:hypothetical protein